MKRPILVALIVTILSLFGPAGCKQVELSRTSVTRGNNPIGNNGGMILDSGSFQLGPQMHQHAYSMSGNGGGGLLH